MKETRVATRVGKKKKEACMAMSSCPKKGGRNRTSLIGRREHVGVHYTMPLIEANLIN